MDKKKKVRLVVIMPAVFTTVVIGGLLTFVLIGASAGPKTALAQNDINAPLPPGEAVPACDFTEWVGQPADEDAVKATGRPYRILHPGDAMTMDYSAERINVEVDDKGMVTNVRCG